MKKRLLSVLITMIIFATTVLADGGIVTLDGGIVTLDGGIVTRLIACLTGGIVT